MKNLTVACAALLAVVGLTTAPAAADSHTTTLGPGDSYQTAYWFRDNGGKVRLVNRTDGIGTDRCIDVIIDWNTNGSGHYDSRIVRNCKPNGIVETDPGGDGYWQEGWPDNCCPVWTGPPWWVEQYGRSIVGVRRGGAYKIDDDTLQPVDDQDMWQGGPPNPVPPTQNGGGSHVRTLYQTGAVDTTDPYHNDGRQADPNAN